MTSRDTISRSELYRLVWSKPMRHLAESYGLSDVGLAKICQRHDIPRPPRGHWAKLSHGKKSPQAPLPDPDRNPLIYFEEKTSRPKSAIRQEVEASTATQVGGKPKVRVVVDADDPDRHTLVERAEKQLAGARVDKAGLIIPRKNPVLNIITSHACLPRALTALNALLLALEKQGHAVSRGPTVKILDRNLTISISEELRSVQTQRDDVDLSGRYEFGHSRFIESMDPNGVLVLAIDSGDSRASYGCQRTWRDTKKKALEERLGSVVSGLLELAVRIREYEEEQKRRDEEFRKAEVERQLAAERRAERHELYRAEKKRFDTLVSQAAQFEQATQIRALVEAVRQEHSKAGPIEPDSEIATWLVWASQQADRIDPIQPSQPSILDETDLEGPEPYRYNRWS